MTKIITLFLILFTSFFITAQQTITEADFENASLGGWQTYYGSIEIQESHNRLAITSNQLYTGARHNLTNLSYTPGAQYIFSLDFNIGDTPGDVQLRLQEKDASGRHLDYYTLEDNLKTGSHTYAYTVNENVRQLVLYVIKGTINPAVSSTFYIDNFKFKEANFLSEEVSLVFTYDASGNQIRKEWVVVETQTQQSSAKQLVSKTVIPEQLAKLSEQIVVYPNPTEGLLMFEWKNDLLTEQIYGITISQLSGVTWEIPINEITNNSLQVDLSNYANGIFIVNFELIDSKRISKKIIKNQN